MDKNKLDYNIVEAYAFVKDYQRMCQTIGNCNKYPLHSLSCDIDNFEIEDIAIIMGWAKKNELNKGENK